MIDLIVLSLSLNQLSCFVEAWFDVQKQKEKKTVKHTASAFFRGLAWGMVSVGMHWNYWGMAILYGLLLGFQYWLSFNPAHNFISGASWYHGNGGFFDSILPGQDNRYKNLALKLSLVLLFAFIYFDMYGKCINYL